MESDNTPKPLTFAIAFIVLFFLSTFATSYRKSVQAAVPVLPATVQNVVVPASLPPKPQHKQPSTDRRLKLKTENKQSVKKVISVLSPTLRPKLREIFDSKGITYPPPALTLIALKEERRIEVWSPDKDGEKQLVITYPIFGESGTIGPKLHKGDSQVPEGIYKILWFNPESEYYLSMKLNYPNRFDRRMAELDGRTDLGGDIFIHGYDVSLGCLAIGNPAIEELFLLVYDTGKNNTRVIISPYDFRNKATQSAGTLDEPLWTDMLYKELKNELLPYTRNPQEAKVG